MTVHSEVMIQELAAFFVVSAGVHVGTMKYTGFRIGSAQGRRDSIGPARTEAERVRSRNLSFPF